VDNEVLVDCRGTKSCAPTYLRTGDFATIKITSGEDYDLYGEPVEHSLKPSETSSEFKNLKRLKKMV
jgi:hypothetical protein